MHRSRRSELCQLRPTPTHPLTHHRRCPIALYDTLTLSHNHRCATTSPQLNQLLLWWRGLTLIEERNNSNKLYLVDATEAAVSAELNAYVRAAVNASKPKEDEDEEAGDDQSKKTK